MEENIQFAYILCMCSDSLVRLRCSKSLMIRGGYESKAQMWVSVAYEKSKLIQPIKRRDHQCRNTTDLQRKHTERRGVLPRVAGEQEYRSWSQAQEADLDLGRDTSEVMVILLISTHHVVCHANTKSRVGSFEIKVAQCHPDR